MSSSSSVVGTSIPVVQLKDILTNGTVKINGRTFEMTNLVLASKKVDVSTLTTDQKNEVLRLINTMLTSVEAQDKVKNSDLKGLTISEDPKTKQTEVIAQIANKVISGKPPTFTEYKITIPFEIGKNVLQLAIPKKDPVAPSKATPAKVVVEEDDDDDDDDVSKLLPKKTTVLDTVPPKQKGTVPSNSPFSDKVTIVEEEDDKPPAKLKASSTATLPSSSSSTSSTSSATSDSTPAKK